MKRILIGLALVASTTLVPAADMKSMDMKGMDMKGDMKSNDMSKGQGTHSATGVVKKVDPQLGRVTLDHEPVKSMKWPAMTMTFQVQDKSLLSKFREGEKVTVDFERHGKDHVITSVK